MKKIFFVSMVMAIFAVMLAVSENIYFTDSVQEPDNSILMLLSGMIVVASAVILACCEKKRITLVATMAAEMVLLNVLFGLAAMFAGIMFTVLLAVYIMANNDIKSWISMIWAEEKIS
ncbi:MAG: hypothetical protein IJ738_04980 [Alphaproteobacteria bacterium]|nr:hypothetical protein [Alphaproteobacteria bacterium]MBR1756897.1 hypothetical protein [Alphaproteobacteria bacterium]